MVAIKFNQLKEMKNDGIVIYGVTDELEDLGKIINRDLNEKGIGTGTFKDKFNGIYELIANDGRRDVVLEFAEKPNINIGKMAIWRVQLSGLVSWISDYVVNNQNDFK